MTIEPMAPEDDASVPVEWEPFRRRDLASRRGTAKGGRSQFYPIYVDRESGVVIGTGEPLPPEQERSVAPETDGCASVFPIRANGTEMNWSLTRESFEQRLGKGYVRVGRHQPNGPQEYVISYLRTGPISDIEEGRAIASGHKADGSVIARYPEGKRRMPLTQWDLASHDAQRYGTLLLNALTRGHRFPFPKSLYAVEDAIRIAIGQYSNAIVLDFFSGSGTTAHAVARLNKQDAGRRVSISVTNNEVSEAEARRLAAEGHGPGDPEWEALGIFEHVTRPRIEAAISGETPDGDPIKGDYKFTDKFPMAEGFEENVEFLELTYLDAEDIELDLAFTSVAPLLWMRAGSKGQVIGERVDTDGEPLPFAATDIYAVLFEPDEWRRFVAELSETVAIVFIVTDSASVFASVSAELPVGVETVRLYENYLSTFTINQGGRRR